MWAWLKYWMDKLESRAFYHLCRLEDCYQAPVAVKFREVRMDCPDMSMQELRQALRKILFHTFPQKYRKSGRNSPCQPTSRWWFQPTHLKKYSANGSSPLLGSGYPSSCKCHKLLGKPGAVQRKPPNTKSLKRDARKQTQHPWKDGKCCCDEMGTFWIPNVNSMWKFHLVSCKHLTFISCMQEVMRRNDHPSSWRNSWFAGFSGILFPTEVARFGETRHQWFCLNVDHLAWTTSPLRRYVKSENPIQNAVFMHKTKHCHHHC